MFEEYEIQTTSDEREIQLIRLFDELEDDLLGEIEWD